MRFLLMAGAACLVLGACGAETPAPGETPVAAEASADAPPTAVMPENDDPTERPPVAIDCADLQSLIAAAAEPVPFASLRGASAGPDVFKTSVAPVGARQCRIGRTTGPGPNPVVHVVSCELFTSGTNDRAKNAELAGKAFDDARAAFTACLPADWTARDGSSGNIEATESMIYESKADAQRAMTVSFYTYPVKLMKEWVEDAASGRSPGWHVTLDFQKDAKQ